MQKLIFHATIVAQVVRAPSLRLKESCILNGCTFWDRFEFWAGHLVDFSHVLHLFCVKDEVRVSQVVDFTKKCLMNLNMTSFSRIEVWSLKHIWGHKGPALVLWMFIMESKAKCVFITHFKTTSLSCFSRWFWNFWIFHTVLISHSLWHIFRNAISFWFYVVFSGLFLVALDITVDISTTFICSISSSQEELATSWLHNRSRRECIALRVISAFFGTLLPAVLSNCCGIWLLGGSIL